MDQFNKVPNPASRTQIKIMNASKSSSVSFGSTLVIDETLMH